MRRFLSLLHPSQRWLRQIRCAPQFHINDAFNVSGVGVVVSGTVHRYATLVAPAVPTADVGLCISGTISVGDELLLGPTIHASTLWPALAYTSHDTDSMWHGQSQLFTPVVVTSLHSKRVPQRRVQAGMSASLAVSLPDVSGARAAPDKGATRRRTRKVSSALVVPSS